MGGVRLKFMVALYACIILASVLFINNPPKVKAVYEVTIYASKDTFISEQLPTSNFGSKQYLLLGTYTSKRRHVLIHFSLNSIPNNAVIISAKLVLKKYSQAAFSASFKSFYVKMVSKYWSEYRATWKKRTSLYSWSNEGGDYYTSPYSYFIVYKNDPTEKTYEIDVTSIVEEWHSGSKTNYGFIIYPYGTADGYVYFYSREYTGDTKDRPKLIVRYEMPSIDVSASPSIRTVTQGETATFQVSVTGQYYSGTVQLSLTGLPSGTTYSFNPTQDTPPFNSILTIVTSSSTPAGTHTLTIKGVGSGVSDQTTIKLKVIQEASFTLSLSDPSLTIEQGDSGTTTITVNPISGYNKKVTLSLVSAPTGVTASFASNPITAGSSTTVTIQVSESTTPGAHTLVFKGVGEDGKEATTSLSLTVQEKPFDFTISVSPKNIEVNQGETAQVVVTVSLTSGSGKEVTLTAIGVPSGATYSFNPSKVTPPGSSVLTINTGSAKGTYTIIVKGTGDGKERTDTFTIKIKEKMCFIATATYGSEVSNEVNILRSFRDNIVLSTYAGQRFYVAFDAFYYSWSPRVAQTILEHQELIIPLRVILYPLIGTLLFATSIATPVVYVNSELAVYMAMTIASSLLGIIYLTPMSLIIARIIKRRIFTKRVARIMIYLTLGLLATSVIAQTLTLDMMLTIAISLYALALTLTSAYTTTTYILHKGRINPSK